MALSTATINAPCWEDWWSGAELARKASVSPNDVAQLVLNYRITRQRIAGRWVYNRYDCEDAIVKINAMRAERAAKQATQSVSP